MISRYFAALPLQDRLTHRYDLLAGLLWGVFNGLSLPLAPVIARRMGMGSTAIAVMLSAPFVGFLLCLVWGHIVDRARYKMPYTFWPGVVSRILLALAVFIRTPGGFLAVVSLYYVIASLTSPAYTSIMREGYSDANRARLMGNRIAAIMLASAFFSWLAGLILQSDPEAWRWLFPVASAFGVTASLVFRRIQPHPPAASHAPGTDAPSLPFRAALRMVGRNKRYLAFMGVLFLCVGPEKLLVPLEPIRLVDEIRVDYQGAGLILGSVFQLASMAGYWLAGRLLRKRKPVTLIAFATACIVGRLPFLALARSQYVLLPGSVLQGLGYSIFDMSVFVAVLGFADPAMLSLYMGVNLFFGGVRGLIGPFLGDLLYSSGLFTIVQVVWLAAGLTVLGLVSVVLLARRADRPG